MWIPQELQSLSVTELSQWQRRHQLYKYYQLVESLKPKETTVDV